LSKRFPVLVLLLFETASVAGRDVQLRSQLKSTTPPSPFSSTWSVIHMAAVGSNAPVAPGASFSMFRMARWAAENACTCCTGSKQCGRGQDGEPKWVVQPSELTVGLDLRKRRGPPAKTDKRSSNRIPVSYRATVCRQSRTLGGTRTRGCRIS
jgi:hypothetical protein